MGETQDTTAGGESAGAAPISGCPHFDEFDPLLPEQNEDPFPQLAKAQSEAPVFYMPKYDMWCVTRHADILDVLRDPILYSNVGNHTLKVDVPTALRHRVPADYVFPLGGGHVNNTDPPQHTRLRKLLQKAFTPKLLAEREPQMREIAHAAIDAFIDGQRTELVELYGPHSDGNHRPHPRDVRRARRDLPDDGERLLPAMGSR